jgi:hypothetical protein
MAKEETKKVGRPSKYDQSFNKKATKLCLLGATDKDLADFFEVNEDTIHEWKKVHPEFSESIKKGKMEADAQVANRLYKRALGYKHADVHFSAYEGFVTATPTIKHYPPDPTAAIFWLKNRQPDKWRDKQEIDHNINPEVFEIGGKKVRF